MLKLVYVVGLQCLTAVGEEVLEFHAPCVSGRGTSRHQKTTKKPSWVSKLSIIFCTELTFYHTYKSTSTQVTINRLLMQLRSALKHFSLSGISADTSVSHSRTLSIRSWSMHIMRTLKMTNRVIQTAILSASVQIQNLIQLTFSFICRQRLTDKTWQRPQLLSDHPCQ